MSSIHRSIFMCVAALAISGSVNCCMAQVEYAFQPTAGIHDWNVDDNWLGNGTFAFVPDADLVAGDVAVIATDATAQVSEPVPRVGQVNIDNSTVVIDSSGELETFVSAGSTGAVILARPASRLEVRDNGHLTVGTVLSSVGQFHVYGPNASVDVGGDILMNGSVLGAHITAATQGLITAGGSADLSGTLVVDVSGITPGLGSSWNLVTASGGIDEMFEEVVVESSPELARGLQYRAVQNGNTAALEVANTIVVNVDRQTGEATIENPVGSDISIAGYALRSGTGSLAPAKAESLNQSGVAGSGWLGSPPTSQLLAEVKPDSNFTLGVGESVSLGNAYALGRTPGQEDLQFDFTTTGGDVYEGIVEYTGPVNDFVLYVDPSDGSAAIGNLTAFISPPELTGYAVLSEGDQLQTSGWMPLENSGEAGSGWDASPALSNRLAELNLEDSHQFRYGTVIELGQIFTPSGMEDLQFLYTVDGETTQRSGTVVYGTIPAAQAPILPGDYDGDDVVTAADYTVWRDSLGSSTVLPNDITPGSVTDADYLIWRANYGASISGAGAAMLASHAVPEPEAFSLMISCLVLSGLVYRRTLDYIDSSRVRCLIRRR